MKAYMAFARTWGPEEGAVLVIAENSKQARKLAFGHCLNVDDWLDQAALLIRDIDALPLADQTKLKAGIPHVVDNPTYCQACELWGAGLTKDNLCGNCNEYPGHELVSKYRTEDNNG